MRLDQQVERVIHAAGEDIVHDLRCRSLYRVVDKDSVLKNLFQRLEQNARIEQLYLTGSPFTQEITRQAHFAFFEEVYALLRSGPRQKQAFEELARYFYRRAIAYLYELAPRYVSSDQALAHLEFKRIAFESSQAAVAHIYERMAWTGGIARPSHFYGYANRAIRRQCSEILFQEVRRRSIPQESSLVAPASVAPRAHSKEWLSVLGKEVIQPAQQRWCLAILLDATRKIVGQNQRAIAALLLAGLDHRKIAMVANKSEQDVVASIAKLFEDWSNDLSFGERLRACFERA